MKKILPAMIIIALLWPVTNTFAYDDGDWQFWITQSISGKVNPDWKMTITNEERFGDDAQQHYRHHTDLGLCHKIDENWKASVHFRYITEKKSTGWEYEHRYYANATYKFLLLQNLKASNKFQLEFRHKENNDFYRFRNKLTINLPKLNDYLKPYVADEIFTDTEEEKLNRNRLYIGIKTNISDDIAGSVFYLWQRDKKTDYWKDTNVIGLKFSLKF